MATPERRWQCTDNCGIFVTILTPRFCPFCGSESVENVDGEEVYRNESDYEHYETTVKQ